jgi:hypothetical protein
MKVSELTAAIIAELQTVSALSTRVYAAASRLVLPPSMKTPLAIVVYKGSDISHIKGTTNKRYVHHFAVYVVNDIRKPEDLFTNATEGLLFLQKSALNELKDQRFTAVDQSIIPEVRSLIGSEDYLQWGVWGASLGFEIDYLEVES